MEAGPGLQADKMQGGRLGRLGTMPRGARVRKATREYNKYHVQGFHVTRLSNNTPF